VTVPSPPAARMRRFLVVHKAAAGEQAAEFCKRCRDGRELVNSVQQQQWTNGAGTERNSRQQVALSQASGAWPQHPLPTQASGQAQDRRTTPQATHVQRAALADARLSTSKTATQHSHNLTKPHLTKLHATEPHAAQPHATQPHLTQPHAPQPTPADVASQGVARRLPSRQVVPNGFQHRARP
jgi:Tfp pilus assembly protein PilW